MSTRNFGKKAEDVAEEYLEKSDFKILDKNWHFHKIGEIDIVAYDKKTKELVFIEVKSRRTNISDAKEMVTIKKTRQVHKLAQFYLYKNKIPNTNCRFDVLAFKIEDNKIYLEHLRNAF